MILIFFSESSFKNNNMKLCVRLSFFALWAKLVKSAAIEKYYKILKYHRYMFYFIYKENKNQFNFYYLTMSLLFMFVKMVLSVVIKLKQIFKNLINLSQSDHKF